MIRKALPHMARSLYMGEGEGKRDGKRWSKQGSKQGSGDECYHDELQSDARRNR